MAKNDGWCGCEVVVVGDSGYVGLFGFLSLDWEDRGFQLSMCGLVVLSFL